MSRARSLSLVAVVLLALLGGVPGVRAAPVELLESDVQAFLQDNGAMDVIYRLTFRDNEGRSSIRKVGPFYEPVHFTRSWLEVDGARRDVSLQAMGGGYYRVGFGDTRTRAGGTYTLELHYRCNHRFADPTQAEGRELVAVWFNPVRWSLPIARSVVKLVLPRELPADAVQRHEDITPAMVDAAGAVTDPANLRAQDQWAWVYSDYRDSRRLTAYAEKRGLPSEGVHLVKLYLPRDALPALAGGPDVEAVGGAVDERLVAEGSAELISESYTLQVRHDRVVVHTRLAFREGGRRNYLPLPSVLVSLPEVRSQTCAASIGGVAVTCHVDGQRLVLERRSEPGDTLAIQGTQHFLLSPAPPVEVREGRAWFRVTMLGLSETYAPREHLAKSELVLRTGMPLVGLAPGEEVPEGTPLPARLVSPALEGFAVSAEAGVGYRRAKFAPKARRVSGGRACSPAVTWRRSPDAR